MAIQSRYPDLDSGLVELEITESAGNVSQQTLTEVMEKFREQGLSFALDDFGSKYSNLAIFTNVYFESIKLDRSLVADIASNENNQMMVRDIIKICKNKKIHCIAEGTETEEQIATLARVGCDYAQGYYYDKPLKEKIFYQKYLRSERKEEQVEAEHKEQKQQE